MPTPAEVLLAHLRRGGFSIKARGDHLAVSPASKLTPGTIEAIRRHKKELLLLAATAEPLPNAPPSHTEAAQRPEEREPVSSSRVPADPVAAVAVERLIAGSVCGCGRCKADDEAAEDERAGRINWRKIPY